MIKRGQKRKETALNDRNLPLKTSSSQSFYPLRVFGENSSQCNLTGRLENVEMRRTDAQYAKSLISFQNSYSLSMLTSSIHGQRNYKPRLLALQLSRSFKALGFKSGQRNQYFTTASEITYSNQQHVPEALTTGNNCSIRSRGSTPVSTVLRKSVRFFIISIF